MEKTINVTIDPDVREHLQKKNFDSIYIDIVQGSSWVVGPPEVVVSMGVPYNTNAYYTQEVDGLTIYFNNEVVPVDDGIHLRMKRFLIFNYIEATGVDLGL